MCGPSVLFDAVVIVASAAGVADLLNEAAAVAFAHDAFAHLKVIGHSAEAQPLLGKAGVKPDAGIVAFDKKAGSSFVKTASGGRIWTREPAVRKVF